MIVYIFYDNFFKKVFLPTRVVGVYPVYVNESRVLLNIEANNDIWHIKPADSFSVLVNGNEEEYPELSSDNVYIIHNDRVHIYLIASPMYIEDTPKYKAKTKEITFGSRVGNSISYPNRYVKDLEYTIKELENNAWVIEAQTDNVYLNDKQVRKSILYSGDYIFCFGVKVIFLGGYFIVNSANNVKVNNDHFGSVVIQPPTGTEANYEVLDDMPLYEKKDYFFKSPRFTSGGEDNSVVIEAPPMIAKQEEMPAILTIGPQLTMVAVSMFSMLDVIIGFINGTVDESKFFSSLVIVLVMIIGTAGWPMITRIYNKKSIERKEKRRNKKYKAYLEEQASHITTIKDNIRNKLHEDFPSLDKCQIIIEQKKNSLWSKNLDDKDFLYACLGTGSIKSGINISVPATSFSLEGEDKLITSARSVGEEAKYIDNAPFIYSFTKNNITAILGEKKLADRLIDNIFLQFMTSHSYADLKIVVVTSPENAFRWEYLKVLPHCWNNPHTIRYFATSIEEFNELSTELDAVFEARKNETDVEMLDDGSMNDNVESFRKTKPYYLVFTDSIDLIRNTSFIKKVLNYKRNLGFTLLIENDSISTLPDQTHGFISVNDKVSGVFTNTLMVDDKNEFNLDIDTSYDIYHCAQLLANTPILLEKGKYELPKSLSFLEMYRVGRVEQLNSLDRWKNNNPTNSLSVPVGIDQNGEIFKMDLHEKAYGPHGLVAGTTGSGKSEWIITFILSLAVNYNPDEVQFVLVDYKGGRLAMSFENKELGIKLPHLAGTITNLDKSAINRSIASIESELKRRQAIFNAAREKLKEGQMDIYKYQQFYRKGMVDIPMSHLFIICDEFAELKQQQPEFMDQLISTSRIGRSLGVHLILATQKPSGVVNDQIWSNSRFKICLRVQDTGDSNEILKKPDAAYLKQVGAFYLEVGNDEYYNLGQSAWAGAKYYPSDIVTRSVDQSVQRIDDTGKIINYFDNVDEAKLKPENSQGEELLNIVKYIDSISRGEEFVKQQLWLPNIPENIYLAEIKRRYGFKPQKMNFTTVIGEYDEPRQQLQNILTIDLAAGNIAIVGQPGSGKEMLLSTLIFSSATEHTPKEINYYILDFGAETLRKFSKFPHVGEVVFQDDMERVGGVIQLVMDELNKRKALFQDYNGSLKYYNEHSGETLPLMCLVINAYDVFGEVLSRVVDSLTGLFRDAPRYGIIFILSASSQNTFRSRILQYFNRFIVLNMQDESQYRNLTNCRKDLIPSNLYGRGICKVTDDDNSYSEFQTAHIIDPDKELAYLKQVADTLSNGYSIRAKKITTIPDNVTSEDLAKYLTTISDLPIGYNFYEKDIAKLDLGKNKIYPVITKDLKANIKFIYGLANLLTKIPNTVVRVIDVFKMFEKPILDIKLFNDDLSVIFAALNNDVRERKETQPLAINIIIGAASLKGRLDATGMDFANQFFNGMANSKQNIYVLVDEYKNFKLLKLEPWYNSIDTSNGMWLGEGLDSQSILLSNQLSDEDKKYNYEGMAYLVQDGNYSLIKTMMDGDD